MSGEQLRVGSWVMVGEGCPMYRMVNSGDEVEFTFGSGAAVFNFLFSATALRKFVFLGLEALREMEQIRAREDLGPPCQRTGT